MPLPTLKMQNIGRSVRAACYRLVLADQLLPVWDRILPRSGLGDRGELEAERYLLKRGYQIVARQYADRMGEIDLIAVDGRTVVFVEVKTRRSDQTEDPSEAVDSKKQLRMTRTAMAFLKQHNLLEHSARFDVVSVVWPAHDARPTIRHFINAFEPTGQFQLHG